VKAWDVISPLKKKEHCMELFDATADPETLAQRADELLSAQRPEAARALLAAARRLAPRGPRIASLAARLDMREGRPAASLAALGQAIAVAPRVELFMLRADARRRLGDLAGAVADAADAVIHDRHNPAAKALLGVLMLDLERPGDAISCLAEAVEAAPANPTFREGLAAALTAAGQPESAAETYAAGIEAAPGSLELRNAAIMFALRQRDFAAAVALAEAARASGIADACTFGLMGHALSSLGRHADAADAYADALKLGPDDPHVRHLAAAAEMQPDATRASIDYVRNVFDDYAGHFDSHLISLGYRIPGVLRNAVRTYLPIDVVPGSQTENRARIGPVLDLGCGTGLVAVALADLPLGPFVGVDLSPRMLERAAAKRLYAGLHESDIIDFLTGDPRRWRLIIAADVLCYLGPLEPLFEAAYRRMLPGGLFICSAEELVGPYVGNGDWVRGRRFAHARGYIARAARAAGFAAHAIDAEVQRHDAGAPVPGFLIVLERPHAVG
jgi:predicted TPR repeat methyltransferase